MRKLALLAAFALAGCASATADLNAAKVKADAAVQTASQSLPQACLAVSAAHDLFLVAAALEPAVAAQQVTELQVFTGLTTGNGLCSAGTLANPPTDTTSAVAAIIEQTLAIHALAQPAVVAAQ